MKKLLALVLVVISIVALVGFAQFLKTIREIKELPPPETETYYPKNKQHIPTPEEIEQQEFEESHFDVKG